jgi:hypothetical protein
VTEEHGPRTAALDTCVAINFIHVGRFTLLRVLPAGLFVAAIRAGLITVEDADSAKAVLEQHRFRLKFSSFRDIL